MSTKTENLYGKTPDAILRETGQEHSIPVDIRAILEHYKISALFMDFSKLNNVRRNEHILSAFVCSGENAAIFYGKSKTLFLPRIRFTTTHELAHVCLTGNDNHIEFWPEENTCKDEEIAANIFAGELLIPERQLKYVKDSLLIPSLSILANIFSVPHNVMAERFSYLGIDNLI